MQQIHCKTGLSLEPTMD